MNKIIALTASFLLILLVSGGCNNSEINEFRKMYGNDVNEPVVKDYLSRTQLHIAAGHHSLPVVKYLIRKGAKPEALDSMGLTPLHIAVSSNEDIRVIKYLMSKVPKIKWTTKDGVTLLHCAAHNESLHVFVFIMQTYHDILGINIDNSHGTDTFLRARDKDGSTPLHWAASNKNPFIFVYIDTFDGGYSSNVEDKSGSTPLDLLKMYDFAFSAIEITEFNGSRYINLRDENARKRYNEELSRAEKKFRRGW